KVAFDELLQNAANDPKYLKRLKKTVEKAAQNTSDHVFHKITTTEHGKPRIVDSPPLLYHSASSRDDLERDVKPFLQKYRASLSSERQVLFNRFREEDCAHKVVGVGSVGTRCYVVLFSGEQDDHLFLQVKEARPSVLEGLAGASPFKNNGERVVMGQ